MRFALLIIILVAFWVYWMSWNWLRNKNKKD